MQLSQGVLLGLLALFGLYAVRLRSTTGDRVVYLLLWTVGSVLVLRPEWSNAVAARLGIGRGADLVFYLFILFSLFQMAATASAMRRLQRDLGALARETALAEWRARDAAITAKPPSSESLQGDVPN